MTSTRTRLGCTITLVAVLLGAAARGSFAMTAQRPFLAGPPRAVAAQARGGVAPRLTVDPHASGSWSRTAWDAWLLHTGVVDAPRHRVIVFGGFDGVSYRNDTYALSLIDSSWTKLATQGTPPAPRGGHVAIYDAAGDRMIVYGGADATGLRSDLWALSLSTLAWSPLTPSGSAPPALYRAAAVYDAPNVRMIMVAGQSTAGLTNGVWSLSLAGAPAWQALSPSGTAPVPREGATAVYDPLNARLVLYAGLDGLFTPRRDTWFLSLDATPAWTQFTGTRPLGRQGHTAVYDPTTAQMIVFGGWNGSAAVGDVNTLSLTGTPAWQTMDTHDVIYAGPRSGHIAAFDETSGRMLVFGGSDGTREFNEAWTWTRDAGDPQHIGAWNWLSCQHLFPRGTTDAALVPAVYDASRHRMLAWGVSHNQYGDTTGELWGLGLSAPGSAWSRIDADGTPPPASGASVVYDALRDRLLVFGGRLSTAFAPTNGVSALSLGGAPVWTQLAPAGSGPAPRSNAVAIYDAASDRVLVYGGEDDVTGALGDVWAVSLEGDGAWTQLGPAGAPPTARTQCVGACDAAGQRMIVAGGYATGSTLLGDVWALSLGGVPAWTQIGTTGSAPPPFANAVGVVDAARGRLVVFGGTQAGTPGTSNDTWALPLDAGAAWEHLAPAGTLPTARSTIAGVYDPQRDALVMFSGAQSGFAADHEPNDTWQLTWGEVTGAPPSAPPGPALGLRVSPIGVARGSVAFSVLMPRGESVRVAAYDTRGRCVAVLFDGRLTAGTHAMAWSGAARDGRRCAAGIYLLRASTRAESASGRIVLSP